MDAFVSKLRNTVQSTVTNLNAVANLLPGNALTREYEIANHVCSAGPGNLWKIYAAIKKSTKEEASLFLLEKRQLDKLSRKDKEFVIEQFKKGVSQLTRLRHPSILTVAHGLEESRDSLAFATEPVSASLANVLGAHDNLPTPTPPDIVEHRFYDVEIKYGLLSLSEGLAFLHNDVKLLHRNVSPESILITTKGCWKLAGFDFSVAPLNPNDFPLYFPFLDVTAVGTNLPSIALPNADYLAPEYVTQSAASDSDAKLSLASDMYALGALTYGLYNKGHPLMPTGGSISALTTKRIEQIDKLPQSAYDCIPDDSRHHVKLLLNSDPTLRPDAHQFSKLAIFEDVLVRTLQYLDALYQWDNLQKSKFYKGLPEIMSRMPQRVKLYRVVPCLAKEFINPDMVPFVLPNVLLVAEEISCEEFETDILPSLAPVFEMKEPIQIAMILMQNMELLLRKCKNKPESIKQHILPMMVRCLDTDAQQVQELCLATIPTVAHLLDLHSIKNALLPKVKKLCLTTGLLSVRVNCLLCIGKILEHLDKWLVLDEIIAFLPEIPSKEPAVIMASIGIIQMTLSSSKLGLTKEIIATKLVPYLMPLSIENGLTMDQFNTIMSLLRDVIKRVEDEHRVKLEQLNSIKDQSFAVMKYESSPKPAPQPSDDIFGAKPIAQGASTGGVAAGRTLSLQDKERLAREKQQQALLNATQPITARPSNLSSTSTSVSSATSAPVSVKPKDLTSSLMNTNLANLSIKSPPQQMPNYSLDQPMLPSAGNQLATNGFPMLGLGSQQQPPFQQQQQFRPQRPLYNPSLTGMQPMSTHRWSQPTGPPMAQMSTMPPMASSLRPMAVNSLNSNSGTSTVVKSLSKSDLDEFLN